MSAAICVIVLTGCNVAPVRNQFPELSFKHLPPIQLEVRDLEVDTAYRPPLELPNVEHEFPVPPAETAAQWARDRLESVGAIGIARYIVREASVLETELETGGGVKGLFTTDQGRRYDAQVAAELEIIGEDGRVDGAVSARARRSITVPEDITLNDLERVWFNLTERLMKDFNAAMERQIKAVLGRFVR
jgi:hypothetical protein